MREVRELLEEGAVMTPEGGLLEKLEEGAGSGCCHLLPILIPSFASNNLGWGFGGTGFLPYCVL